MNKNEYQTAARIRAQYLAKEKNDMDALRELDARVKRPARIFSYIFGSISAIIMGAGMSLVMTDIGASFGIENAMIPGIVVGAVGMIMALVNYPIYKGILGSRKKKYSGEILALTDKMLEK